MRVTIKYQPRLFCSRGGGGGGAFFDLDLQTIGQSVLQSVISACNSVEFLDYFQSIYPANCLPAKFGEFDRPGGVPTPSWGV